MSSKQQVTGHESEQEDEKVTTRMKRMCTQP